MVEYYCQNLPITRRKEMNNTKILIADENLSMRASLRDELKEQGFANIYEAQNGEEALAMIIGAEPEIVIIDVLLSKLDGIGVIRQARERLGEDAPTFIATSMVGNHNMLLEASSAGASM
jgi:CheY-like chemotaxis protein